MFNAILATRFANYYQSSGNWKNCLHPKNTSFRKKIKLNTVTYETAILLIIRRLLLMANELSNSDVANVIKRDFYVNDLNTGCNS